MWLRKLIGSALLSALMVGIILGLRHTLPTVAETLLGWEYRAHILHKITPRLVWLQVEAEQQLTALRAALDAKADVIVIMGRFPATPTTQALADFLDGYEQNFCPHCPPIILQRPLAPRDLGLYPVRQYTPIDIATYDSTPVSWGHWAEILGPQAMRTLWQPTCAIAPPVPALPGEAVPILPLAIAARWLEPNHATCDLNRVLAQYRPHACDQPMPRATETTLALPVGHINLQTPLYHLTAPPDYQILTLQDFAQAPNRSAQTVHHALTVIASSEQPVLAVFSSVLPLIHYGNGIHWGFYFVLWLGLWGLVLAGIIYTFQAK